MMTTKASRYKGKGIILHTSFPFVDQIQAALSICNKVAPPPPAILYNVDVDLVMET